MQRIMVAAWVLGLASVSLAANDLSVQISDQGIRASNSEGSLQLGITPSAQITSAQWVSTDGEMSGSYALLPGGSTSWTIGGGELFFNLASAQAAAIWTMTIEEAGQTSVYQLAPDFSGIDTSQFADALIPQPGPFGTSAAPTFNWSIPTGEIADNGYVELYPLSYFETAINVPITGTTTSWTAPAPLPYGVYSFWVEYTGLSESVPLNPTLISGPALNIPSTATFAYSSEIGVDFNVVPEPTCLALLALPLALTKRRPSIQVL